MCTLNNVIICYLNWCVPFHKCSIFLICNHQCTRSRQELEMIDFKRSVLSLVSMAKMKVICYDLPTTNLPESLALTINAIKCSPGNYKLIKTSRTITALEGLRLASNQVITQLEYDLDLVYECGLVQLVMDKDVTAPLVKAKEMCYILPFLAFSFATVANKKARI